MAKTRMKLRTLEATAVERHASWLELFFDLVFVIAVSQIARVLTEHSDVGGLVRYIALFAPVWWLWVGFTFYADQFETEETTYRVLMFAGMLGVVGLSLTLGGAFSPAGDPRFIVCSILVRLIVAALYARAAYYVPLARAYCLPFIAGIGVSASLFLVSWLFEPPVRYAIWAIAFLIELAIPFLNPRATRAVPIDRSHIPERLGLFTIIVLGEAVIATANSAGRMEWGFATITTACLGFAMAACIWWINFDFVEDSAIKSRDLVPRFVYLFGHFFIVASIVAVSIGVEHAIRESVEAHLQFPTLMLLSIGLAVYLIAITFIRLITRTYNLIGARIAAIAVVLSFPFVGHILPSLAVMSVLFVTLAGAVWLEVFYAEEKAADESPHLEPCDHTPEIGVFEPRSTDGCEECVKNNYKWVHLRLCMSCGHVGCCDTSVHKHATMHFHESSHPIIASLEPDENWAWCYLDSRYVPLPDLEVKIEN